MDLEESQLVFEKLLGTGRNALLGRNVLLQTCLVQQNVVFASFIDYNKASTNFSIQNYFKFHIELTWLIATAISKWLIAKT